MSIVTKSIVNADAEARYLSPGELDRIKAFVTSGAARLRIAETLTGSRETIIKDAGNRLFQKRPDVVSPGGNAYGEEMTATCLRDMDYYLRHSTYAMLAGDPSILDERVLNGLKETYNSLGVPIGSTVQAIQAMKEVTAGLVGADAGQEMGVYFDYICSGLS